MCAVSGPRICVVSGRCIAAPATLSLLFPNAAPTYPVVSGLLTCVLEIVFVRDHGTIQTNDMISTCLTEVD